MTTPTLISTRHAGTGRARRLGRVFIDQEHLAMTASVPAACTTAAAVRTEALGPALDLIAIAQLERDQLVVAAGALRELAQLSAQREQAARRIAGFVDRAAERLAFAEREGSYEAVASELGNGRQIAARLRGSIDALAGAADRHERDEARRDLHALFETFGADLFTKHGIAYLIGKQRTLAMRGEFTRWEQAR